MDASCGIGCSNEYSNKIEKIPHEAARIATGLSNYNSLASLYFDT